MNIELLARHRLKKLIQLLRKEERLPLHLEVASAGTAFIATAHNEVSSPLMPESVTTGLAFSPDTALLKALTEYVERAALIEAGSKGVEACLTDRSDGIAAFPKVLTLSGRAKKIARSNAYAEAVERFVWANWWDDSAISFNSLSAKIVESDSTYPFFKLVSEFTSIKSVHLIQPSVSNSRNVIVLIFIVELNGGGFISGGAAGTDFQAVKFRAASELLRHSLAIRKIKDEKIAPESFYEKRLSYFGLGAGDKIVRERLSERGDKPVALPNLRFDTAIKHSLDSIVAVHRCYFENQPAFIGGELERLCI